MFQEKPPILYFAQIAMEVIFVKSDFPKISLKLCVVSSIMMLFLSSFKPEIYSLPFCGMVFYVIAIPILIMFLISLR